MKLNEIKPEGPQDYKIFVDVDGVLADFDLGIKQVTGKLPHEQSSSQMWKIVGKILEQGAPFFSVLPKMADAADLWTYVKPYYPTILTSTGHRYPEIVKKQKQEWIKKHFGNPEVHTVQASRMKANYAQKNHILIDDRSKSIDPWIAAGGIGILHKNANDTIGQLKQLGL